MASEEQTASGRQKRRPLMDVSGDLPGSNIWPAPPWTKHSGNLRDSSSFSDGPSPHPQPTFTNGPQDAEVSSLKPVRRFIPPSWKNFFQKWWRKPCLEMSLVSYSLEGARSSSLGSPVFNSPQRIASERGEISSDEDEDEAKEPTSASTGPLRYKGAFPAPSHGDPSTGPPSYREKLEAYNYKYAYMKSWPGLLRLIGGLELLLGGMVFACTAAYIQKDYQWPQLYGGNLPYNGIIGGGYGYNYYGPMTPFVLVVASLTWLVTVILLGLGVTMYYRTILLDSHWWPLAEFALNLLLFLLYMAASIAYVNDVNRGGLCYSLFASNPLIVALCRVEGGQVAAIAFLFITTLLYLTGSLVCLKMWRHEAARRKVALLRLREAFRGETTVVDTPEPDLGLLQATPRQVVHGNDARPSRKLPRRVEFSEKGEDPAPLSGTIPTGCPLKPHVIPDYVIKYPEIRSVTEWEKYKAVFNDQYAEYKELHREVRATRQKLKELGALLTQLPHTSQEQKERSRVSAVWRGYRSKEKDRAFLEKEERCEYLRRKLSHIKARIQAYAAASGAGGGGGGGGSVHL